MLLSEREGADFNGFKFQGKNNKPVDPKWALNRGCKGSLQRLLGNGSGYLEGWEFKFVAKLPYKFIGSDICCVSVG